MTQQLFCSLVAFSQEIFKNLFYTNTQLEIGSNNGYTQQDREHNIGHKFIIKQKCDY